MSKEKKSREIDPLQTPFENIALAFSGGGFRAASYSLGVLSYFDHAKLNTGDTLLQKVTYISSASGGTITNALYAMHTAKGLPFTTCYKKLFEELIGTKLLDIVFDRLNNDAVWEQRPEKRRNLINAFALAYDEILFAGTQVGDIEHKNPDSHLDEVCFNTTDLYKGLLFRQTIKLRKDLKTDPEFLYGNFTVNLNKRAVKLLKLSDLLAASSCFPAGFEPIIFPNDFTHKGLNQITLLADLQIQLQEINWEEINLLYHKNAVQQVIASMATPISVPELIAELKKLPIKKEFKIGLMDGGITDNMGLESMIRANERRIDQQTSFKPFDLMLVNDVGSHFMDPYQLPVEKKKYTGWLAININFLRRASVLLGILGAIGVVLGFGYIPNSYYSKALCAVSLLVMTTGIGIYMTLHILKKFISGNLNSGEGLNLEKNFSPSIVKMLFKYFGATPLGVMKGMCGERADSVLALNNDVFLKRIRKLLYSAALDSGIYTNRLKANHVYDLAFANDRNRIENDCAHLAPNQNIQIVAQNAFEMPTTLWFDTKSNESHKQAALIACGQFTTCYNLLEYIERLQKPEVFQTLSVDYQKRVNDLQSELMKHYDHFKRDPFWLYNQLGIHIQNFQPVNISNFPFPPQFKGLR